MWIKSRFIRLLTIMGHIIELSLSIVCENKIDNSSQVIHNKPVDYLIKIQHDKSVVQVFSHLVAIDMNLSVQ